MIWKGAKIMNLRIQTKFNVNDKVKIVNEEGEFTISKILFNGKINLNSIDDKILISYKILETNDVYSEDMLYAIDEEGEKEWK